MKRITSFIFIFLLNVFAFNVVHAEEGQVSKVRFSTNDNELKLIEQTEETATFSAETYENDILDGQYLRSTTLPIATRDNKLDTFVTFKVGDSYRINFTEPMDLTKYYGFVDYDNPTTNGAYQYINVTAYDSVGKELKNSSEWDSKLRNGAFVDFLANGVSYVTVSMERVNANQSVKQFKEFAIFGEPFVEYTSVSDLKASEITENEFTISFKNPIHTHFSQNEIYVDGKRVSSGSNQSFVVKNLTEATKYTVEVVAVYKTGKKIISTMDVTTVDNTQPPDEVTNLTAVYENSKIKLTYNMAERTSVTIYRDNKKIKENHESNEFIDTDISLGKKYVYKVVSVNKNGESLGVETVVETPPLKDVTNLTAIFEIEKVKLTYDVPVEAVEILVYKDGEFLGNGNGGEFVDVDIKPGQKPIYKVVAVDKDGNKTNGVTASVDIPTKEIKDLKAKAAADRVDLSWQLPTHSDFSHVVIYRTDLSNNVLTRMFRSVFSGGNEVPLFETNGTYFNDLTVKSDTQYRYRVASVLNGVETTGLSIDVNTPPIKIEGGNVEEINGDYTVTWIKPTKGEVKIYVGGKLYATVEAALKKHTIPAKDMKYTALGAPDIKIVPVDEEGKEIGVPTTPGGVDGGIEDFGELNASNLLKIAVALLGVVGGFVLLGLSFRVVPKLIQTIRAALGARNKKDNVLPGTGRRT